MILPPRGTKARAVIDIYRRAPSTAVTIIAEKADCRSDRVRRIVSRWQKANKTPDEWPISKREKIQRYFEAGHGRDKTDRAVAAELGVNESYVSRNRPEPRRATDPATSKIHRAKRKIEALRRNHKLTGKNAHEIAERIQTDVGTTRHALKRLGIRPLPKKWSESPDEIAAMANRMLKRNFADGSDMFVQIYWMEGEGVVQIAEMLGFSTTWVRMWMKRLGVPRRPKKYIGTKEFRRKKPWPDSRGPESGEPEKEGGGEVSR